MISQLRLINWKSHENSTINFSHSTNLLIGPMGAGKTSAIDAICFGLFGTFPALKTRRVSLEDVLMDRPAKKQKAQVEITFHCPDKYTVTRTVAAGGTEAFLRDGNGKLLEGPQPIRVSETVARLLGVDYEVFVRAVYSEQNRIDYFLSLGKGERKKQIDELLGIEVFETARSSSASLLTQLRNNAESAQKQLAAANIVELENQQAQITNLLVQLTGQLEGARQQLNAAASQAYLFQSTVNALLSQRDEFQRLSGQASSLAGKLQQLQSQESQLRGKFDRLDPSACTDAIVQLKQQLETVLVNSRKLAEVSAKLDASKEEQSQLTAIVSSAPSLQIAEAKLAELNSAQASFSESHQSIQSIYQQLVAEDGSVGTTVMRLNKDLLTVQKNLQTIGVVEQPEAISAKLAQLRQELTTVSSDVSSLMNRKKELQLAVESLATASAECPTCNSPLAEEKAKHLATHKSTELQNITRMLSESQLKLAELAGIEKETSAKLPLAQQALLLTSQAASLQEQVVNSTARLGELKAKLVLQKKEVEASALKLKEAQAAQQAQLQVVARAKSAQQSVQRLEQLHLTIAELATTRTQLEQSLATSPAPAAIQLDLDQLQQRTRQIECQVELQKTMDEQTQIAKQLQALNFAQPALDEAQQALNHHSAQAAALKAEVAHLEKTLFDKQQEELKLRYSIESAVLLKQQAINATNAQHEIQVFQSALIDSQATLRSELIGAINQCMTSIWKDIYPYTDYKSARIETSETDYSLLLQTAGGEWKPVEQTSGGERACASLALRVAFAMVLVPNLNWLVLDEPTHNLDRNAVALLARALHDSLPSIVKQTLIVTHDEALKEGASGAIHVFHRNKNAGEATVVETLT